MLINVGFILSRFLSPFWPDSNAVPLYIVILLSSVSDFLGYI